MYPHLIAERVGVPGCNPDLGLTERKTVIFSLFLNISVYRKGHADLAEYHYLSIIPDGYEGYETAGEYSPLQYSIRMADFALHFSRRQEPCLR
jgi:hypothetical protein